MLARALRGMEKTPTTNMEGQAKNISHNVSAYAMFRHGIMCPIGLTVAKYGRGGGATTKIQSAPPTNRIRRVVRPYLANCGVGKVTLTKQYLLLISEYGGKAK